MPRLSADNWNPQVNDAWVQGGIDGGKKFRLASPTTINNLRTQRYPHHPDFPTTVIMKELKQLRAAGYRKVGDYMIP